MNDRQLNISLKDVELLQHLVTILYEWSGASDSTPDDTEIIGYLNGAVTLGDLRDVTVVIEKLKLLGK